VLQPGIPRAVQVAVPGIDRGAHVVGDAVGRPAERMIRKVDLAAFKHAAELREDLLP
jgi:hypothetical protein